MRSESEVRAMLEAWKEEVELLRIEFERSGRNHLPGMIETREARIEELEWVLGERSV